VVPLLKKYNKKMPKQYSEDFRRSVVTNIQKGMTWKEASHLFEISEHSINRWLKLKKETGSLRDNPRGFYKTRKIDKQRLREEVMKRPDATLKELAQLFNCCHQAVHKACLSIGLVRKKR